MKMSTTEVERRKNFHIAVEAIFKNWTALQMAVKQGSAGPQSQAIASWMVEATIQWFYENKNLEVFEVEDFLEDILNHEFNLVADDGSVNETSKLICEYYNLCTNSNITAENIYEKLKHLPKCDLSQCKIDVSSANDDDVVVDQLSDEEETIDKKIPTNGADSESMDIDTDNNIATSAQTDSDGWTMVSRKKK